jgi:hypothetical protein
MTGVRKVKWDDVRWDVLNERGDEEDCYGGEGYAGDVQLQEGCRRPSPQTRKRTDIDGLEGVGEVYDGGRLNPRSWGPGRFFIIPSNVGHAAEVLEDTQVIDVFSPPREDWLRGRRRLPPTLGYPLTHQPPVPFVGFLDDFVKLSLQRYFDR